MTNDLSLANLTRSVRAAFSALTLRRDQNHKSSPVPHVIRIQVDATYRRDCHRLWRDLKSHSVRGDLKEYIDSAREEYRRLKSPNPVIDIGSERSRLQRRHNKVEQASASSQP